MDEAIKKADVLIEALPYIRQFRGRTFVIKYGGSILGEETIRRGVLQDIVFLSFMGIQTVLVHGGGPNISDKMRRLGIKTEFVDGMRVTDAATLAIVEEELDELNALIVDEVAAIGATVLGVAGHDCGIIKAQKIASSVDMGFVGSVCGIDTAAIAGDLQKSSVVVISPMGKDAAGVVYNINADEAASHIAGALGAEKFVLLTNVKGVMRNPDDADSLIASLRLGDIKTLIAEGVIQSGMIPKVNACIEALERGVKKTHIIDARISHGLLLEIFTDQGVGTEIVK